MKNYLAFLSVIIISGNVLAAGPSWLGPYAGLQVGYSSGDVDHTIPAYGSVPDGDIDGALLGIFAGYNWSLNSNVIGVEFAGNRGDVEGSNSTGVGAEKLTTEQDWDVSAVIKLGAPMNNYMVYGLVGAARTKVTSQYSSGIPSADDTVSGWVAGAGIEGVLSNDVNWRIEYRHADYDKADVMCTSCGPTNVEVDTDTVTAGILMYW